MTAQEREIARMLLKAFSLGADWAEKGGAEQEQSPEKSEEYWIHVRKVVGAAPDPSDELVERIALIFSTPRAALNPDTYPFE